MSLKKLPPTTTRRLSSSQVISSVCDAVKELVENALDSGATSVNVKLTNYGLDKIEVQDNGSGVPLSQVEFMCLSHYTSKINDFSDLGNKLETYGFRGEALAALCNLADIEITTRTVDDEYASVFTFDKDGKVLDSKPSHLGMGTTVAVLNIFGKLPVRKKFMSSSSKCKGELKKAEMIVKNFAIVNSKVYFSFYHNKCLEWQKSFCQTLKESAKCILGYSVTSQLEEISTVHRKIFITMLLPNKDCKNPTSLCFVNADVIKIFINRRPINYKKLQKIILKYISEYFGVNFPLGKYPTCILNIQMAPNEIDVNVEPNKMKILCHEEDDLFVSIGKLLETYYKLPNFSLTDQSSVKDKEKPAQCKPQINDLKECAENTSDACLSNVNENRKGKSVLKPSEKDMLWKTADNAMGFWNNNSTKSASGDEQMSRSKGEISNCKTFVEHCTKRFRCSKSNDNPLSPMRQPLNNSVNIIRQNAAASEQTESDIVVQEVYSTIQTSSMNDPTKSWDSNQSVSSEAIIDPQFSEENRNVLNCLQSNENNLNTIGKNVQYQKEQCRVNAGNTCELERGDLEMELSFPKDILELSEEIMPRWSKGKIQSSSGNVIEGGAKLLPPMNIFSHGTQKKMHEDNKKSNSQLKQQGKSCKLFNTSAHSVSSQMGRKEMSGFARFCEERRPQILLKNPEMFFTSVAQILTEEWKKLSQEERAFFDKYVECAKTVKLPDTLSHNPASKMLNRSLKDMFPKTCKIRRSCSWEISRHDWEIKYPQDMIESRNTMTAELTEFLHVILPEELWLYKRNCELGIIRPLCLQERTEYENLEANHSVPIISLDKPQLIKKEELEPEMWQHLKLLDTEEIHTNIFEVVNPIITKNGFRLIWNKDELYLTHVASTIRHYGVDELREILYLIKNSSSLSQCRPVKVTAYLESEAVRIINKKSSLVNKENMTELLQSWNNLKDNECFHQKPVFKILYTLPCLED